MHESLCGQVLSAVSPAVVVPRMVRLIEEKYGTGKSIPQMILAGASCDDNAKERLFCVIAYLPKATVQAAIGSVPLSLGLPCGKIVLSVAVMAILITALLGAIGIDKSFDKLLVHEK